MDRYVSCEQICIREIWTDLYQGNKDIYNTKINRYRQICIIEININRYVSY